MTRFLPSIRLAALLCAMLAVTGCVPGINAPVPTATPDLTLVAIPRMLTLTATAPTVTLTPVRSPTPTPTPTSTPTATPYPGHLALPGRIGQRMPGDGVVFTILSVENPETLPGLRAREGQRYVEFDVLVENPTAQEQEYNRMLFRLAPRADGPGQRYEPLSTASGPLLLSGMLRPGEWVRGRMAFVTADDAPALWLQRQPGANQAEIWVDPTRGAASPDAVPATGSPNSGYDDLPGTGEDVSAAGVTLSIDNTTISDTFERVRAGRDKAFLILDATITNDTRDRAPFNAEYFRLKDANGYEYTPVVLPSDALIIAGSLARGQRVSGKVIFNLPEDTRSLVVKYRPQVLVEEYEEIRVRIEGE